MFPPPSQVLATGEGTLAATPLPRLLQALHAEARTATLELRLRGLEKRIQLEDGCPVACRSNLLHETLGKFLVGKGRITEEQYQRALSESVVSGQRMGELLVAKGLVAPYELYRQMQANLALRILDAFRWTEGTWRLVADAEPAELALRVNPAQLVLTGCAGFLPFDVVATELAFTDEQRFGLAPSPPHALAELKVSTREAKLLQVLRRRPTFARATAESGLEVEEALRRLYALAVLGFVELLEEVAPAAEAGTPEPATAPAAPSPEPRQAAPDPPPEPEPEPAPQRAAADDDDPALRDALVTRYLDHRTRDPFDLLGVAEAAPAGELRRAFLALADRFSPLRFSSADLREKAEALLAAHARAYGALADPEQAALWRKRRAAAAERARGAAARPSASEQFRIATDLLDASTQFAEGRRRLEAGSFRGALEYFQYAADIEPSALHRAHLGWARYRVDPARHERLALQELAEAARAEPGCAAAHRFAAEIHREQGRLAEAEEACRRAFKADPADRRAQELALELLRARKAAR